MSVRPWRGALFVLLALLALAPFGVLLAASVARSWFFPSLVPDGIALESWAALAGGRLGTAARNSVALALGVGAVACAASFGVGRALARLRGWHRHVAAAAVFLPVAAPPIALGVGLQYSFLRLGLSGSFAGVLLSHLVPAVGYASLYFLGVFAVYDDRIEAEARTLGAGPAQVLLRVTLPLLRRPLAEAFLLGFLVSWAQVPLTLLIGGGVIPTLPVEVLSYMQAGQDRFAATGALLLVAPPLVALAAVRVAARNTEAVPV